MKNIDKNKILTNSDAYIVSSIMGNENDDNSEYNISLEFGGLIDNLSMLLTEEIEEISDYYDIEPLQLLNIIEIMIRQRESKIL